MKSIFTFLFVLVFAISSSAQFMPPPQDGANLMGGMGVTWIDGQPYYNIHLTPELSFGNYGLGLDINLEFGADGNVRTPGANSVAEYLRFISYFRYGFKGDPVYFRIGQLRCASLGHGSIMYMYNNSPSYDARKVGVEFDLDFNRFGFETIYSSFLSSGILGVRGYVRPLQFTSLSTIPILGKMEVGASLVTDNAPNAGVTKGYIDDNSNVFVATQNYVSTTIMGLDIGLPVVRAKVVKLDIYLDYAKIMDFGDGISYGFNFGLEGLGLIDIYTKFERRHNSEQYLPSYFNALYELERFTVHQESGEVSSKVRLLENATSVGKGWYGELYASLLGTFNVLGSYQRLDNYKNSGILHLAADVQPDILPILFRAGYDKSNIGNESGLFTIDEKSTAFVEFGYKPYPYLVVSLVTRWTFLPIRDQNNSIIDFEPQKRVEPKVSFVYPLNF